MRALLVVNPRATTSSARTRSVITSALEQSMSVRIVQTQARGHAMELAAHAASGGGLDIVIALGGDGTVNEIVNGLLAGIDRPDPLAVPALGIVPGGNANVMSRSLGIPVDPVEATGALMAAVAQGRTRQVGLGRANGRWFTFGRGPRARRRGRRRRGACARVGVAAPPAGSTCGARSPSSCATPTATPPALTVLQPGRDPATDLFFAVVQNTRRGPTWARSS